MAADEDDAGRTATPTTAGEDLPLQPTALMSLSTVMLATGMALASIWWVATGDDLVARFTPAPAMASWAWALPIAIGVVAFAWQFNLRRAATDAMPAAERRATARTRLLGLLALAWLTLCGIAGGGVWLVSWLPAKWTVAMGEPHQDPAVVHARGDGEPGGATGPGAACVHYAIRFRPAGSDDLVVWCGGRDAWARDVPGTVVAATWRTSAFGTVGTGIETTP